MRILIIGTGALGCFYGGKLVRAGADVTFLSRGKSFFAIRDKGIIIKSYMEGIYHTDVHVVDALSPQLEFDLIILATKSYDVATLVKQLPDQLYLDSYFMTLQNGVLCEEILLKHLDSSKLLPCSAFVGLRKVESNVVEHSGGGRFQYGSYNGGKMSQFEEKLFSLCQKAEIDVHHSENIMRVKWGKLVWNASYNPLSTITRLKLGEILSCSYGVELLRGAMNETVKIAKIVGYEFDDTFIEKQINLPKNLYGFKTSMLQDFMSGKQLEVEPILGYLIEKGKQHSIDTPVLNYFYSILQILIANIFNNNE